MLAHRLHIVVGGRVSKGHQKPLMLFVHGFPELWDTWWQQMRAFQDDYVVAALDMRGYGDSEIPEARLAFRSPARFRAFYTPPFRISPAVT